MSYDCKDDRTFVLTNGQKHVQHKQNAPGTKERQKLEGNEIVSLDKIKKQDGIKLNQLRNQKGISQVDLAKKLNIEKSLVQKYEDGSIPKFVQRTYNTMIRILENMPDKNNE